jgi:hypothetical protein
VNPDARMGRMGGCCTTFTTEPRQTGSPAVTVQRSNASSVAQCTVGPTLRVQEHVERRCSVKWPSEKDGRSGVVTRYPHTRALRVPWPAGLLASTMSGLGRKGLRLRLHLIDDG